MSDNLYLRTLIPIARRAAYSVRAIRRVIICQTLAESVIREATKNIPNETGFIFEKKYDPKTGSIIYPKILEVRLGKGGETRIGYRDCDNVNSGHVHPFESGTPKALSAPMSINDSEFIRRLNTDGNGNMANNAHVIWGGNPKLKWGVGAWTYDEMLLADGTQLVKPAIPDLMYGIYSCPLEIVRDGTNKRLSELELRSIGIVFINNTKPYLKDGETIQDTTYFIKLRQWVIEASRFLESEGKFRFSYESEQYYIDKLKEINNSLKVK
ncbi:MAG: hypothetical protein AABX38_05945 [Candidatus Micrarchaeota archaeon]